MLVGIHSGKSGKWPEELNVYEKILDFNNISHIRLNVNEPYFWEKVKTLDLFIYVFHNATDLKEIAWAIIPIIEKYMNIRCFPDLNTCWPYDDKIKEFYLLSQYGFPVIPSHIFWDKQRALQWLASANFPKVFKLKAGSQSSNVLMVKNKHTGQKLVKKMFGRGIDPNKIQFNVLRRIKDFRIKKWIEKTAVKFYRLYKGVDLYPYWDRQKNYVIFQDYMPDNKYDTRITIIGDRAFGLIRHNRKDDFRASGSGKKDYDLSNIDMQFVKIAFQVSEKLKFRSMAFDFLYNEKKEPVICEISYKYPLRGIFLAPGYWDRQLNWHKGNFWPQYLHLVDALQMPDLIQPSIDVWEDESIGKRFKKIIKSS